MTDDGEGVVEAISVIADSVSTVVVVVVDNGIAVVVAFGVVTVVVGVVMTVVTGVAGVTVVVAGVIVVVAGATVVVAGATVGVGIVVSSELLGSLWLTWRSGVVFVCLLIVSSCLLVRLAVEKRLFLISFARILTPSSV